MKTTNILLVIVFITVAFCILRIAGCGYYDSNRSIVDKGYTESTISPPLVNKPFRVVGPSRISSCWLNERGETVAKLEVEPDTTGTKWEIYDSLGAIKALYKERQHLIEELTECYHR